MPWTRINYIDNLRKMIDEKKPERNSIEKKHKKKPKIEEVHRPDRFDLDIIKITHR